MSTTDRRTTPETSRASPARNVERGRSTGRDVQHQQSKGLRFDRQELNASGDPRRTGGGGYDTGPLRGLSFWTHPVPRAVGLGEAPGGRTRLTSSYKLLGVKYTKRDQK